MRVVLDTNVLVSAFLSPGGVCDEILRRGGRGDYEICLDRRMLTEYEEVLSRPRLLIDREEANLWLAFMRRNVGVFLHPPRACELPDPDDIAFLEVAAEARAILVTGNLRHFPPRARSGVTVLTPAEFLASLSL